MDFFSKKKLQMEDLKWTDSQKLLLGGISKLASRMEQEIKIEAGNPRKGVLVEIIELLSGDEISRNALEDSILKLFRRF